MKFLVRWAIRLLVLAVVLVTALLLLKNLLLREWLESRLRRETGLEVRLAGLELALFSPTVRLEGLRFHDPAGFGGAAFLDCPEVYLEYDAVALPGRRVHLRLLRVQIAELAVVRDAAGGSNLEAVRALLEPRLKAWGQRHPELRFGGIDALNLSLAQVRRQALGAGARAETVRLGARNAVYQNLVTGRDVARALTRFSAQTGLGQAAPESTNLIALIAEASGGAGAGSR